MLIDSLIKQSLTTDTKSTSSTTLGKAGQSTTPAYKEKTSAATDFSTTQAPPGNRFQISIGHIFLIEMFVFWDYLNHDVKLFSYRNI